MVRSFPVNYAGWTPARRNRKVAVARSIMMNASSRAVPVIFGIQQTETIMTMSETSIPREYNDIHYLLCGY